MEFITGYFVGAIITGMIAAWLFGVVHSFKMRAVRAELGGTIRAQQRAFAWALREMTTAEKRSG